jgi:hypothetical protein
VTFTFNEAAKPITHPHPEKHCSINLGWKAVKGGRRVATLFDGESAPRHVVLPQVIVDKLAHVEELQGRVNKMARTNVAWLLKQIDDSAPRPLDEAFMSLKQVKGQHSTNFAKAVTLWQEHKDYLPEVFEEANRLQRVCSRLFREYHHLRDKVIRRREDFYRCRAKELAESYGIITLDKLDLRQLAHVEKGDGQPTTLHKNVRHARTVAAVSVLREWIVKQATKVGAQVNIMAVASGTTCHSCGAQMKSEPSLTRTCLDCGANWDQDENAAINLFRVTER